MPHLTVVTYQRRPLFADAQAVDMLRQAVEHVVKKRSIVIEAEVVLPDHLHTLWTLQKAVDYSTRWRLIKEGLSGSTCSFWRAATRSTP